MRTRIELLFVLLFSATVGCHSSSSDGSGGDPGTMPAGTDPGAMNGNTGGGAIPPGGLGVPMVSLSGHVLDFDSAQPVAGSASVAASGVQPLPSVSMSGADFVLTNVQPFSVFYLIASSPPDYRATYNAALTVGAINMTGLAVTAVKDATVSSLASAFNVTPAANTATLMARAIDANGMPLAGVPAAAFGGPSGGQGPFFLDEHRQPAPSLTATSASGWAVFLGVPPGSVQFAASPSSGWTVTAAVAPVAANLVTLADVIAQQGMTAPPPPSNVSFANQVVPIFGRRGCTNCHSGNGPGRDEGGLTLDASAMVDWRNLVQNISPNLDITRVNLQNPEQSLVLRQPSYNPPEFHPTVVFASNADPDYQLILAWIKGGALNN